MFHTYIRASSGNVVDIDRASFLMDRDLLSDALRILMSESARDRDTFDRQTFKQTLGVDEAPNRLDGSAQLVWDKYCKLHEEKYGGPFTPDGDPHWDSS